MTSYIDAGGTQTSSYNGDGLKASEGSTTIIWDGADYLGEVISGSFAKKVFTVSGRILGERSAAYGRLDYGLSPLGNVDITYGESGIGTSTSQQFKPYGERINFYGAQPIFGWLGAYGYRPTGYGFADYYVRARHYSTKSANWTTLDPLWPEEWGFVYVGGMPTGAVDFWGMQSGNPVIDAFLEEIGWKPWPPRPGPVSGPPAPFWVPSGITPMDQCGYYRCNYFSFGIPRFVTHRFFCAYFGPEGKYGCAQGLQQGAYGDTTYDPSCGSSEGVECELVTTNCAFAEAACACRDVQPPFYTGLFFNCLTYESNVFRCACGKLLGTGEFFRVDLKLQLTCLGLIGNPTWGTVPIRFDL